MIHKCFCGRVYFNFSSINRHIKYKHPAKSTISMEQIAACSSNNHDMVQLCEPLSDIEEDRSLMDMCAPNPAVNLPSNTNLPDGQVSCELITRLSSLEQKVEHLSGEIKRQFELSNSILTNCIVKSSIDEQNYNKKLAEFIVRALAKPEKQAVPDSLLKCISMLNAEIMEISKDK